MAIRCRIRYPMSNTSYRMRYRTFFKCSLLPAGPAPHPSAPPSDAGDNPPWNSDDERNFAEHAYSPPSLTLLLDKASHIEVSLVFFSTFEPISPISLTPDSCMQKNGIPMLYEQAASQLPTLYVCPVELRKTFSAVSHSCHAT